MNLVSRHVKYARRARKAHHSLAQKKAGSHVVNVVKANIIQWIIIAKIHVETALKEHIKMKLVFMNERIVVRVSISLHQQNLRALIVIKENMKTRKDKVVDVRFAMQVHTHHPQDCLYALIVIKENTKTRKEKVCATIVLKVSMKMNLVKVVDAKIVILVDTRHQTECPCVLIVIKGNTKMRKDWIPVSHV